MNILALSLLSAGLYSFGTLYQFLIYIRRLKSRPFASLMLGVAAAAAQLSVTMSLILEHQQLNLSFFNSASLITCLVVICLLILSTKKPLQTAFLAAYPVAISSIAALLLFEQNQHEFQPETGGMLIHIGLSILSYSIFCIAAIQAVLIKLQNNNLKKKNPTILMRNLPPLLTMENLLFEMIWTATSLLGAAIIMGFIFVDDIFAQHLAHKTFFSILGLGLFSILLAGRKIYGWRGATASNLTLWGVTLLMLGFFGSKFVLEWLV